jgi:hypothetical protein
MEYYTYAYLREDKTPYYIGKGQGNRAYRRRKTDIKPPKDKSRILILKKNLTEEEAFNHEIYMISVFGRKDLGTGILYNRTDGGEGTSNLSVETRKKTSKKLKGENNPNYGKRWWNDGKGKCKMSVECPGEGWVLGNINVKKDKHPQYGKPHTEETKRKQSKKLKGENNPFYGKTHTEESKRRQSEVKKGENNPNYGKRWWNDGCGNVKFTKECPGKTWSLGIKS